MAYLCLHNNPTNSANNLYTTKATTSLFKVKEAGKFLPFLKKEGLKAFKLIIFKLDTNNFSIQDALIWLNKEFNWNTLRVVNAGS